MEFYEGLNHPIVNIEGYLCDRCKVQSLIEYEYDNCVRSGFRYCMECFNWLHLQIWIDINGNKHTIRSERRI